MPDQRIQGDPGITQVSELIRLAKRFGLVWTRRPGTVESVTPPYDPRSANVIMDGDDGGIPVTSLAGDLAVGMRVMVDVVPPAGNYATAIMLGTEPLTVTATTSTATVAVETVSLTLPSATYRRGSTYEATCGNAVVTTGTGLSCTHRVRKGTTVGGTLWGQSGAFVLLPLTNAFAQWRTWFTPTVDVTTQLVLTFSVPGAGGAHVGSATIPRWFSVRFAGDGSRYPQAINVA